jgi:hypothetical protein
MLVVAWVMSDPVNCELIEATESDRSTGISVWAAL